MTLTSVDTQFVKCFAGPRKVQYKCNELLLSLFNDYHYYGCLLTCGVCSSILTPHPYEASAIHDQSVIQRDTNCTFREHQNRKTAFPHRAVGSTDCPLKSRDPDPKRDTASGVVCVCVFPPPPLNNIQAKGAMPPARKSSRRLRRFEFKMVASAGRDLPLLHITAMS